MRHRMMTRVGLNLLGAAALAGVTGWSWPLIAQRGGAGAAGAAARAYLDAAAKGQFQREDDVYDDLVRKGMNELEATKAVDTMKQAYQKWADKDRERRDREDAERKKQQDAQQKKAQAEKDKDQNLSGTGDWDFGQVYRDRDYPVSMPVENNCRIPQEVTITYPKAFLLEGPASVVVPAKSTVDVTMTLTLTKPPLPSPPYPPGLALSCYDLKDALTLHHKEAAQRSATSEYICHEMTRTYAISMHVHQHGPPDPNPGGGGGGSRGRGRAGGAPEGARGSAAGESRCQMYWEHDEFYPGAGLFDPEQCRAEIRPLAKEYFGPLLRSLSLMATDPRRWAWIPDATRIDALSVAELKALKKRADELAAPRYE